MERLQRLVADPAVTLLVAQEGDTIVGTTTVVVYTTPFWIKARLDEVVVDHSARGKGVGEALVKVALQREAGFQDPRDGRLQDRVGVVSFSSRSTIDANVAKAASTGPGDVMSTPAMRRPSSGYIEPALARKAR